MINYIAALVDELYELGVRDVVLSPGARSTPLAMLFCEHEFKTYVNIDERSAGFFALGIAKVSENPVVLVCTSGSAVANYMPAVIEAKHSRVPLIILSADRPHELRGVGAPQTIDQNRIFSNYAKFYEELLLPEESESMYKYVRTVMSRAYTSSITNNYGVSHINIPLREPLTIPLDQLDFTKGRRNHNYKIITGESITELDMSAIKEKKGIIICGGCAYSNYEEDVIKISERLNAPILADPISNIRSYSSKMIIDSYDAFLRNEDVSKELEPDYIISFGQVPISKSLQKFIAYNENSLYIYVDKSDEYRNSALSTNTHIMLSPKEFSKSVHIINEDQEYLNKWIKHQVKARKALDAVECEKELFEGKIVKLVQRFVPKETRLMVSNSMAIRYIDSYFSSSKQDVKILCNRGANGIDGIVSTALGICAKSRKTVLITGDLSFYHDISGLLVGKTEKLDLTIILFNNDGGGIFNHLPQSREKNFEYLFSTPHGMNFEGLKLLYGINYMNILDYTHFESAFNEAMTTKGINLLEVSVNGMKSKEIHDRYTDYRIIT